VIRPASIAAATLLALGACASPRTAGSPPSPRLSPSPAASGAATPPAVSPDPSPPAAAPGTVFVIVMENKSAAAALDPSQAPYTAGLARRYGLAEDYFAITHPSLPNYLALTSGSTWGISDDGYHVLPARDLGHQLTAAGVSWRAYMEGMTGGCFHSPYPYALKHNPFAYYGGACPANVVPLTALAGDLSGSTPRFVWITPGLCNDTHDCPVSTGDRWLRQTVPEITASAAWRAGGVLFITWDEGYGSINQVATVVVAPWLGGRASRAAYNHHSLLATIEIRLGVGRLGEAAKAPPMADLVPPG
jgi:phospholipase C